MDSLLFNKKTLFTPILVNLGAIKVKRQKEGGGGYVNHYHFNTDIQFQTRFAMKHCKYLSLKY